MYVKTKYLIKVKNGYLDPISSNLGLRQGCPMLFNQDVKGIFEDSCYICIAMLLGHDFDKPRIYFKAFLCIMSALELLELSNRSVSVNVLRLLSVMLAQFFNVVQDNRR